MENGTIKVKHTQKNGRDRVEIYPPGSELAIIHAEWPVEGDAQSSAVAALYAGIDKARALVEEGVIDGVAAEVIVVESTVPGAVDRIGRA